RKLGKRDRVGKKSVDRLDQWPDGSPLRQGPEMRIEASNPGRRPRAAKLEVELAHSVEEMDALIFLAADQRVLEQRKQRDGREILSSRARNCKQQRAGWCC